MREMLKRLDEAPEGKRKEFKDVKRFAKALARLSGVEFFPCLYGPGKGAMCATIAARTQAGTALFMVALPGTRMTIFSVRRAAVPGRQLMAEVATTDAQECVQRLKAVHAGLDEVGALLGDELAVEACGLKWALKPIGQPPKDPEDMRQKSSSSLDPAMEARVKAALAKQLAKERAEGGDAQPEVPPENAPAGSDFDTLLAKVREAGDEPTVTESGLAYVDAAQGEGDPPGPGAKVRVNYAGRLADGTEFDSSASHGGPIEFRLDGVIPAWTEGVGSMRPGGKRRLLVPPPLGYGERGFPPKIPPNAALDFDVELLDVVD